VTRLTLTAGGTAPSVVLQLALQLHGGLEGASDDPDSALGEFITMSGTEMFIASYNEIR
jgi:hypothetical protein